MQMKTCRHSTLSLAFQVSNFISLSLQTGAAISFLTSRSSQAERLWFTDNITRKQVPESWPQRPLCSDFRLQISTTSAHSTSWVWGLSVPYFERKRLCAPPRYPSRSI